MGVPLIRRVAGALPLLLVISAGVFGLLHLVPGGPLAVYLSNPDVRAEDLERLRRSLGLDQPVWRQYVQWLAGFLVGDWGYSYSDGRPVLVRVWERVPATLELVSASLLLAMIAAAPLGITPALTRWRWPDRVSSALSFAGLALPVFWFGLVLQLIVLARPGMAALLGPHHRRRWHASSIASST